MISSSTVGGLLVLLYLCFLFGVGLFTLVMLWRFVTAHERIASALDRAARALERNDRPPSF
jgi:hypothetical protein